MPSPLPNPFVGPRPFEAGETLYGREREIAELGDRLVSERIVLLHSPSGAGKSSLVRAGLLPELRRSFDVWGPTRVNQEPANGALNRYAMSAVQGFEEEVPERGRRSADVLAGQTLAEYFTGRPRRRRAAPNVLLVFDQFEEVLTVDALAVEAKEAFFDQLGEVLRIPRAFALFVLREDYLAPLDPYSRRVPTHLRNRFRIDLLGLDAAREAMVEPARTGGREFPAVDQLVHDLATRKVQRLDGSFEQQTGRHVEPVQLQVTCRRLWDRMPPDDLSIDPEDVKRFGDVTEALGGYYADSVKEVAGGDAATKRAVREWFDHRLITAGGIRGQVLREAGESGGLANELIEALRGTHLIRAEERAGAIWYELAHDRLVEPVQRNNKDWRDAHLSTVQQRATLWERQERPPGLLMKDEELAEGERWAANDEAGLTDVERRFLAASRKEQDRVEKERRRERRFRVLAVVSVIAAVLAGWFGVQANDAKNDAEKQRKDAVEAQEEAVEAKNDAEKQRKAAVEAEEEADRERQAAVDAKEEAVDAKKDADKQKQAAIAAQQSAERQARIATSGRLAAAVAVTDDLMVASLLANESWSSADTSEAKQALFTTARRAPRWKATIRLPFQRYDYTDNSLISLAFGPDGKILASASRDKTVRLWDVARRQPLGEPLTGHESRVYGVAFSPDGKTLASASRDKTVRLWDVARRQPLGEPLTGHESRVYGVAFSPDGKTLASAGGDYTVRLWDVARRQPLGEPLTGHKSLLYVVRGVAFSPDGKTLASASEDKTVRLWDVATRQPLGEPLTGHKARVNDVAFSPDGKTLASASGKLDAFTGLDPDKTVRLWDVASRQPLGEPLTGHEKSVHGVAFSPDGKTLASASEDKTVRLWNVAPSQSLGEPLPDQGWSVKGVAFSPDRKTLASTSGWTVRLWDVARRQPLGEPLTGHKWPVNDVAFSPDGKILASAGGDKTVRLWDVASRKPLGEPLTGHSSLVLGVAFSPDGKTLASASATGNAAVRLWDVATHQLLGEPLTGHRESMTAVAFSPDGKTLTAASEDSAVRLWDVATHQPLGEPLIGHRTGMTSRFGVSDVVFSPDGKTLASASKNGTVQLWDVATRQPLGELLTGHKGDVFSVAFSPDGKTLASASRDRTVRLWDVATRQPLGEPLTGHTSFVVGVAFSPDGKTLASASTTVRLWDIDPISWVARGCARAARNLSLAEWRLYMGRDVAYRRTCLVFPPGEGVEETSAGEPQ